MGGTALPPVSSSVNEEEEWVEQGFMPGQEGRQHVRKLGGFLRGLEEEREMEGVREARQVERRLDDVGEEFDEDSDDEEAQQSNQGMTLSLTMDQEEVKVAFEKKLLELFIDGIDVSHHH